MDKDTNQWDFNRTIYAHNMSRTSDAMFSPLLNFKDEDYFMAHRQLYYTECYGDTAEYQLMAVVKYNAKDTGSWDFRTRNHADWKAITSGWSSCRNMHYIMRSLTMPLQRYLPFPPVTVRSLGKTEGWSL